MDAMAGARSKRPRSLRVQFALGVALLGVILAALLSISLGAMVVVSSRHDAAMRLQGAAGHVAQLLSDGLFDRLREVQILAGSPSLWAEGLHSVQVQQALVRSQAMSTRGAWIGVADHGGRVRAATGESLVGTHVGERPWFAAALKSPYVSGVHADRLVKDELPPAVDGGPNRFVDFAAPIVREGRTVGVLAIHSSWDWTSAAIESLMPAMQQRNGLEIFVFDREGRMIYAPGTTISAHWRAGQRLPVVPRTSELPDGQNDARISAWQDGVDYLTTAVRMEARSVHADLGWVIVARQPLSLADAAARRGSAIALALGLIGAFITAGLGWWLASRLARPLHSMAKDATAVGTSGTPAALPAYGGSLEVEQLSAALAGMIQRLAQTNAALEDRVRERTTELERANAELDRLARFDPLTGLLNRRGFDERMANALAAARRRQAPLSVLLVDADHFKRVNDVHGHDVGDQVLQAIAQALRHRVREVDFVARIGGEEFVVVLVDTGLGGAAHVADDLLRAVRQAAMPGVGPMTVSCGVAEVKLGGEAPEAALKRADVALYRAKQAGRDRYCLAEEFARAA